MIGNTLTVIGGTYFESCIDPASHEMYGSGLRGAAALSDKNFPIELISCVGKEDLTNAQSICEIFNISPSFTSLQDTVTFSYYHPLSTPYAEGSALYPIIQLPKTERENILYYGMIEADMSVHGNYVVYDPQNHESFKKTGSTARHLALILNRKEAYLLSEAAETTPLEDIGKSLIISQNAEVVVIKNGSQGALVIDKDSTHEIPVFKTDYVWKIGSGDVFSAVFAWKWIISKCSPKDSAMFASQYTASYCESKCLPVPDPRDDLEPLKKPTRPKKIYLAGPFFNISQRWIINEFRNILTDFGNEVFSPYHDIGLINENNIRNEANYIASKDISAIQNADLLLAVLSSPDPGTLFEIGYAKSLKKEVIVFVENFTDEDLVMLYGTDCKIVSDFTTAVYSASW